MPDFAGGAVVWFPGNDPPDILCIDPVGKRIGVELVEWLNEEQIRTSVEEQRLESSYLDAIRSQDVHPPENTGTLKGVIR